MKKYTKVKRKTSDHIHGKLIETCILHICKPCYQLDIHEWTDQKTADVDTETIQTIFVQNAVYCVVLGYVS